MKIDNSFINITKLMNNPKLKNSLNFVKTKPKEGEVNRE